MGNEECTKRMGPQEIFNIAYAIALAGTANEALLIRTFFMRSGIMLPFQEIMSLYNEILRVVNSKGYSDPLDFLKDFFPSENFQKLQLFKKNLCRKIKLEKATKAKAVEPPEAIAHPGTQEINVEEPKRIKVQSPKKEENEREVVQKPIKIKREVVLDSPMGEMTPRDRIRVMKYKKQSKRFKEMDPREKDMDNRYDHFMYRSKLQEVGQCYNDSRSLLVENPFMGKLYADLDLEFREMMYKIYKYSRTKNKDKSQATRDLEFLEEYFNKKLDLRHTEACNTKLSNSIAYWMKKLQNKIFECDDKEVVETMQYFKARLCAFYNFYRK
ncbi:hypothetical protein GINT2_000962 [Glugoides intestinalis]